MGGSVIWSVAIRSVHPSFCTFSINSIHARRSMPKSMNSQWMPSFVYSSCSRTNMWWLKNCWSFSLVKLMHSCSKLLNCSSKNQPCFSNIDIVYLRLCQFFFFSLLDRPFLFSRIRYATTRTTYPRFLFRSFCFRHEDKILSIDRSIYKISQISFATRKNKN